MLNLTWNFKINQYLAMGLLCFLTLNACGKKTSPQPLTSNRLNLLDQIQPLKQLEPFLTKEAVETHKQIEDNITLFSAFHQNGSAILYLALKPDAKNTQWVIKKYIKPKDCNNCPTQTLDWITNNSAGKPVFLTEPQPIRWEQAGLEWKIELSDIPQIQQFAASPYVDQDAIPLLKITYLPKLETALVTPVWKIETGTTSKNIEVHWLIEAQNTHQFRFYDQKEFSIQVPYKLALFIPGQLRHWQILTSPRGFDIIPKPPATPVTARFMDNLGNVSASATAEDFTTVLENLKSPETLESLETPESLDDENLEILNDVQNPEN